jgi:hypothetical protein
MDLAQLPEAVEARAAREVRPPQEDLLVGGAGPPPKQRSPERTAATEALRLAIPEEAVVAVQQATAREGPPALAATAGSVLNGLPGLVRDTAVAVAVVAALLVAQDLAVRAVGPTGEYRMLTAALRPRTREAARGAEGTSRRRPRWVEQEQLAEWLCA